MTLRISLCTLAVLCVFATGSIALAQEDPDLSVGEEMEATSTEEIMEFDINSDLEGELSDLDTLTDTDIDMLIDTSEEVVADEIADEPVVGTVLAVEGDEALIYTSDGDVVRVSIGTPLAAFDSTGEVGVDEFVVGSDVVIATEGSTIEAGVVNGVEAGVIVVMTAGGEEEFTVASAPIVRNGENATLSDIREGDEVRVVVDEAGEVLALTVEGDDAPIVDEDEEDNGGLPWWMWVLIVAVVLGIIWRVIARR